MVAVLREVEMTINKTTVAGMATGTGTETVEGTSETMEVEEEVHMEEEVEEEVDTKEVAAEGRAVDSTEGITAEDVAIATIVTS